MNDLARHSADIPALLNSGGVMARIREHDWAVTPIGPLEDWLLLLCTLLAVILRSTCRC